MGAGWDVQLYVAPDNQAACVIGPWRQCDYAAVCRIGRTTSDCIVDRNRNLSWRPLQVYAPNAAVNGVVCTCAQQQDQGACHNACCAAHGYRQDLAKGKCTLPACQ